MANRRARWKTHDQWMCLKHVPPVTLPATAEQCWMRGCSSQRPSTQDRPEEASAPAPPPSAVLEAAGVQICAWEGCNSPARPNSKYCSRKCSNKNARKRFRARKREQAA